MAARAPGRLTTGNVVWNNLATGAIGFFLQFNLVPIAWHIPITRITLLLMVPCIVYLVQQVIDRPQLGRVGAYCLAIVVFLVLHIAATGMPLSFGASNSDLALTLGFALYFIGGIGLYLLLTRAGGGAAFCWGLLLGALCSLPVMFMEARGMKALAIALGLAEQHQVTQQLNMPGVAERLTGMWAHANEVGHVLAITTPAAGYLYITRQAKMPLLIVLIITLVSYYYTVNRGGVIASVVTLIVVLFVSDGSRRDRKRQMRNLLYAGIGFMIIIGALYILPTPEFLWKHLTDEGTATQNASGRLATTLAGIQTALQSPFGMLQADWMATIKDMTGFRTTHNGFLSFAFDLGALVLPLFIFALGSVIFYGFRKRRVFSLDIYLMLAAVQLSVSFMFEELSHSDAFMLIAAIIMARVYSGAVNVNDRQPGGGIPARRQRRPPLSAKSAL